MAAPPAGLQIPWCFAAEAAGHAGSLARREAPPLGSHGGAWYVSASRRAVKRESAPFRRLSPPRFAAAPCGSGGWRLCPGGRRPEAERARRGGKCAAGCKGGGPQCGAPSFAGPREGGGRHWRGPAAAWEGPGGSEPSRCGMSSGRRPSAAGGALLVSFFGARVQGAWVAVHLYGVSELQGPLQPCGRRAGPERRQEALSAVCYLSVGQCLAWGAMLGQ